MGCVAFEETLANIKGQSSLLGNLDERAVEIAVILPLLSQVGWNTGNMAEVYPQSPVDSGGKVDYALKVDGKVRILVEVKSWNHRLQDGEENQLAGYCHQAKPDLAVLTNGRRWRLYVRPWPRPQPQQSRLQDRLFLDLDIVNGESDQVEAAFKQIIARDKLSSDRLAAQTVKVARDRLKEKQGDAEVMAGLTDAWNDLAKDNQLLAGFVEVLADSRGIQPTAAQVERFLQKGSLVNKVPESCTTPPIPPPKPRSFTFQGGDEIPVKSEWSRLLVGVCLLMRDSRPDEFRDALLAMPEWFTESKPASGNWPKAIGDTGIYAHFGDGNAVKRRCAVLLEKFGHPLSDLTIKSKNGEVIPLNPP